MTILIDSSSRGSIATGLPVQSLKFTGIPGFSRSWHEVTEAQTQSYRLFAREANQMEACRAASEAQLKAKRQWPELAAMLEDSSRRYGVPERVLERLSLLAKGKAVAVVTGQQVGFLGGPFYTFLKAYHATRLATSLEERLGVPVLPIFWLEGEDHDLEEIRHAHFLNKSAELQTTTYNPETIVANQSVGMYPVSVSDQLTELEAGLEHVDATAMQLFKRAYGRGTLSEGMGRFIAETLGPRGMLVVEGMDQNLKALALPLWEKIVDRGSLLNDKLAARSQEVIAAGYPAPIHPTPDSYLFYLLDSTYRRCPVTLDGRCTFEGREQQFSGADLLKLVREQPHRFSPKAALRPLYQDFVLPTVAYVAGPGELNYHSQLSPFYAELGVVPPSLFPRLSVTIQDRKTARNVEKLGLSAAQIFAESEHALKNSVLSAADETRADAQFDQAKAEIEAVYSKLKNLVGEIDPTLVGLTASSAGKSLQPLEQLREKTARALKHKHAASLTRIDRAISVLKPGGKLAERYYSSVYYIARYGQEQLMLALDALPLEPARHHVITLD